MMQESLTPSSLEFKNYSWLSRTIISVTTTGGQGVFFLHLIVGGERNMKQRILINSITSKLVLKSIYASGSTGPFFDNHFMNKHDSSFAKKTDFLSRYLVLSEIRCARKKSNQKQEQNLLSRVVNLFEIFEIAEQEFLLDSLLSAWTFVYWNMNTRWKYFLNYYHRILFNFFKLGCIAWL